MPVRGSGQAYRRSFKRSGQSQSYGYGQPGSLRKPTVIDSSTLRSTEATSANEKAEATELAHAIDESMGFARYESGKRRVGWLCNMHSTSVEDEKIPSGRAGVDFYFIGEEEGDTFKATVEYDPYFLVAVKRRKEAEVEEWCRRTFEGLVKGIKRVEREDLQLPNHLLGYKRTLLKLSFANVNDLLAVRRTVAPIAERNKKKLNAMDIYTEVSRADTDFDLLDDVDNGYDRQPYRLADASDSIVDIREYDVPYHVRVAIDKDIRIGKWYTVEAKQGVISLSCIEERLQRADPVVMAFDIETTKLPLKFPDAAFDQIMMISYMIDGQGFLITNREIVSEDIADFDYTPKAEYEGPFMIFNEADEKGVLERFFEHIKECRPTVIVTYNGDFFDWPFVEARASICGIDMYREIGFRKNSEDIYRSDYCAHMDAFAWVNRDSYLPQGSRGLKAVTVAKLGYDPDELDPELMTPYARDRPQILAEYSVSDAVATYYLYMKYVHPFIFSLCTIIPLGPDDVLRKGTGTLCEMLLMVQAYKGGILLPNKHQAPKEAFWDGHLLESETYVGGHVESIEAGVFRSDIPCNFSLDVTAIDELLNDLDAALTFSITIEEKTPLQAVEDYEDVKSQIAEQLLNMKKDPNRSEKPSIYHLDVASMYPNIMTTNRLQPDSMIQESDCAACDFNRPGKTCDRRMPWSWRGEFLPAKRDEYNMIRHALESEKFPGRNGIWRTFQDLSIDEQASLIKKRLQDYCKKIYHKIHDAKTLEREAIICQRENPFYVDTVKNFRDRRYDFKGKQKIWKGKIEALKGSGAVAAEIEDAKKMVILFDSLQLAHKVILNSFYGYVMRKGSRWYSMEMAGVTCLTGARIIQMARQLVERIGRPLELDTDGIWCILPASFPENFTFKLKNGKKLNISYPCVMLNHLVHEKFTNHQYQTLVDPKSFRYATHSDNTIFFEVDGPYKAMILPTSKEEDKNLKKRYAVFNHDGSLAELKGFEVKRRGELKLIKIFQTQIFKFFLEGSTLTETYASVAKVANRWLDVLDQHGTTLADEELIDLICENKSMTKTLEEYGAQKSTAITTAKRLAEFLGEQMVKDKGLNCKYIISSQPRNAPVTERAVPVAIFSAEEHVRRFFLRKWLRADPGDMDPRSVIDWSYYLERLGSVIQKLITIPAALQKVPNPVPRVSHPDWLERRIRTRDDVLKQSKMTDLFERRKLSEADLNTLNNRIPHDLEDFGSVTSSAAGVAAAMKMRGGLATKLASTQKRKSPDNASIAQIADPFATLPSKMPSITEDYQGWLHYQKQKWKIQKQVRQRRRQLFGERRVDAGDAISSFFRNQAQSLFTSTWQILELRETEVPGEVRAYVLIGNKVHCLKIIVPRQVFVNFRNGDLPDVSVEDCTVEKVMNHTLPSGHPSVHLFKIIMPEDTYVRERKKRLALLFNHPSVEGVYERQVPLNIRTVLQLGNVCTFDESQKGVLGKGLDEGFALSTLRQVAGTPKKAYMDELSLEYIYLYHLVAGERQAFALFSTTKSTATVVLLNKAKDTQGLPNMNRIYRELLKCHLEKDNSDETLRQQQQPFLYQEELIFRTIQVATKRKAQLELTDALKRLRTEESRPFMLVVQSNRQRSLLKDIPALNDLPLLKLRFAAEDQHLPSVGWQNYLAKRLVSQYLDLGLWISHMIQLARYGNIPLCNLQGNDPRFLIDVIYARRLQQDRVVLWWSPNPRPDHASHEKDDILGLLEKVEMPSTNNPGTYSSVCIDISVRNLAINTILSSALINEAEGSDSLSLNPTNPTTDDALDSSNIMYSESAFAAAGIIVLREMVKTWWAEACHGNTMADFMVQHLVRWIASPSSFLYDRSLHYYVQMMSKKALQQLMTDFRRVGSNVVYSSVNRLLLQTSKIDVGNAYAYSQYIVKAIKAKPLFTFLDLEITEYWDYLAWYDEYNYGGKGCKEVVHADEQRVDTIMHWHFSTFLPLTLQDVFQRWAVEFIDLMHARKRASTANVSGDNDNSRENEPALLRSTQLPFRSLTSDSPEVTHVLDKSYAKPLQKDMANLLRRQHAEQLHPDLASDYAFPVLPGTRQAKLKDPVLQLVKTIVQVLSLDRSLMLETRLLRKELLHLFDIREFSPTAAFTDPSVSLKLPQPLICADCTAIRPIDLCKDSDLLPIPPSSSSHAENASSNRKLELTQNQSSSSRFPEWKCPSCFAPYDKLAIEESLVADVQRIVLEWTTQDVRCERCAQPRTNDFMEHCMCAGKWVGTMNMDGVSRRLEVYMEVSRFFEMRMLEACVGEVTEGMMR